MPYATSNTCAPLSRTRCTDTASSAGSAEPACTPATTKPGARRRSSAAARSATPGAAPRKKVDDRRWARCGTSASTSSRPGTRGSGSPSRRDAATTPLPSATTSCASRAIFATAASWRASITNSGFAVITKLRSPASRRRRMRSAAPARSTRSKPTPSTSTRAGTNLLADGDEASAEEVDVLQRQAGALRHAVERVLRDVAGDAGDLRQELVHVAQQRAAARQDHSLVDHVGRQLRRGLFENGLHRRDDLLEHWVHRLGDLVAADRDHPRQTRDEVTTSDLHRELLVHRHRGPDLDLHVLGGALADHQVVPLAHEVRDRLIELVARGTHAARDDDAAQRDHRDLRGAAADVDDQVPARTGDRDVRADRRGERLLDEVRDPGAGTHRRVLHGAALDARHARRDADHELGVEDTHSTADLVDEVLEHVLGDDVVGDDAVTHRLLRGDVPRGAPQHQTRFLANRDDARPRRSVVVREGDHRRLGEDDPLTAHVHDDVGRAEIDAYLLCEQPLVLSGAQGRGNAESNDATSPTTRPTRPQRPGRSRSRGPRRTQ